MNPLLEMRSITKEFPGVKALDGVTLDLQAGEFHALVGENGAGKVLVTRQDAQKDALQNIAQGKQTMTVYKPIIPLANKRLK